jgi:hypothetical protein
MRLAYRSVFVFRCACSGLRGYTGIIFSETGGIPVSYVSTRLAKKAKIVLGPYPRESRTIMTTFSTIHWLNRFFYPRLGRWRVEGARRRGKRATASGGDLRPLTHSGFGQPARPRKRKFLLGRVCPLLFFYILLIDFSSLLLEIILLDAKLAVKFCNYIYVKC